MSNSLVDRDVMTFEGENDSVAIAPIKFCDTHLAELRGVMDLSNVPPDQEVKISHGLFSLAARTVGTEVLCQHRCPICAFKNFDFIGAMVNVFAAKPVAGPVSSPSAILLS